MSPSSPSARSLAEMRRRDWTAQVVERWVPQARRRIDLFGVIDILALDGEPGCIGIQATTGSNHASRRKKALAEPRLLLWLRAGNRFEVWSWRKGANGRWTLRSEPIEKGDVRFRSPSDS